MSMPNTPNQPYQQAPGAQFDQNWGQPQAGSPAPVNPYTGFSIGAVVAIVGAVLTLVAYPLVWFVYKGDESATVTGFGSTSTSDLEFHGSRLHWLGLAVAVAFLGIGVARLLGKFKDDFKKPTIIAAVLGVVGPVLSLVTIDSEFKAGTGLYLAVLGSVVMLVGGLLIAVAKK